MGIVDVRYTSVIVVRTMQQTTTTQRPCAAAQHATGQRGKQQQFTVCRRQNLHRLVAVSWMPYCPPRLPQPPWAALPPTCRMRASSRTLVPPTQAWHLTCVAAAGGGSEGGWAIAGSGAIR
jgi:hypothetical protein